jgi:hypothetical protein
MCLLWSTNLVLISQKMTFFIVTAVKTSNLTQNGHDEDEVGGHMTTLWSWVALQRPQVVQPLGRFSAFYKVHYRVHKSSPPVAILNQTNPVHTTPFYPYPSNLCLGLPSGLFLSGLSTSNLHVVLLLLSFPNSYLNCNTFSNHVSYFISIFWSAFWSLVTNIYLVSSTFTSRPTSLLSIKVSVCLYSFYVISQ